MSTADATAVLRRERDSVNRQIEALTRDVDRIVESSRESNSDDEHDPEGQTIAFERAQVIAMIDQTRQRLTDLDTALARLGAGSYGTCVLCGAVIAAERLAARPETTTCIDCARRRPTR
jgi:DnaK suppressor protein